MIRNFNKAINASRFTRPNNILLAHCQPPVYLAASNQPSIEHVNTIKAFFRTVNKLQNHKDNATYKTLVLKELQSLNNFSDLYIHNTLKYVELGGRLTAQGLANLYATAENLKINSKWLQIYAQPEIPYHLRNMSIENLNDLISGLNRFNGSQDFINLAQKELSTRNQQSYEVVKRSVHEIAQFEELPQTNLSNNLLIQSIESQRSIISHYLRFALRKQNEIYRAYFGNKLSGYILDA